LHGRSKPARSRRYKRGARRKTTGDGQVSSQAHVLLSHGSKEGSRNGESCEMAGQEAGLAADNLPPTLAHAARMSHAEPGFNRRQVNSLTLHNPKCGGTCKGAAARLEAVRVRALGDAWHEVILTVLLWRSTVSGTPTRSVSLVAHRSGAVIQRPHHARGSGHGWNVAVDAKGRFPVELLSRHHGIGVFSQTRLHGQVTLPL